MTSNLDEADTSCMFIKLLTSEPCFDFSGEGRTGTDGCEAKLGKYIQVPGFDAQMSDEAGRRPGWSARSAVSPSVASEKLKPVRMEA